MASKKVVKRVPLAEVLAGCEACLNANERHPEHDKILKQRDELLRKMGRNVEINEFNDY